MSLPAEVPQPADGMHPGNFRHELLYQNTLPDQWKDLYEGLITQAELQVKMLYGSTALHSMLIERASYLFVRQKMLDQEDALVLADDPGFQASYNALIRQFLKVTDQLSKYEVSTHVSPEAAFLYTVMEVVNIEVTDPATKRRIGERLMALRRS